MLKRTHGCATGVKHTEFKIVHFEGGLRVFYISSLLCEL